MQKYSGFIFILVLLTLIAGAGISVDFMQSEDPVIQTIGGAMMLGIVSFFIFKLWPQGNGETTSTALSRLRKQWGWFLTELGTSILQTGLNLRGEKLHIFPAELLRTAFNEGYSMSQDNFEQVEWIKDGKNLYRTHTAYDGPDDAWHNSEIRDLVTKPEPSYQDIEFGASAVGRTFASPYKDEIKAADDSSKEAQVWAEEAARSATQAFSVEDEIIDFSEEVVVPPRFVQIDEDTWVNPDKVVSIFKYGQGQTQITTEDRYYIVNKPVEEVLHDLQGLQCCS